MQQKVVKVSTRMNSCPLCSAKLVKKYNKNIRHIITLKGEYWVRERVLRCSNRECPGHALSFRAEDFQAAIIPYKIFGLDVILHIGTLRYEEHKTYAEIKEALRKKNIKISIVVFFTILISPKINRHRGEGRFANQFTLFIN